MFIAVSNHCEICRMFSLSLMFHVPHRHWGSWNKITWLACSTGTKAPRRQRGGGQQGVIFGTSWRARSGRTCSTRPVPGRTRRRCCCPVWRRGTTRNVGGGTRPLRAGRPATTLRSGSAAIHVDGVHVLPVVVARARGAARALLRRTRACVNTCTYIYIYIYIIPSLKSL